jgi:hypothetical protein
MESLGTDVYSYRSEFKFPFLPDLFPVFLYARTGNATPTGELRKVTGWQGRDPTWTSNCLLRFALCWDRSRRVASIAPSWAAGRAYLDSHHLPSPCPQVDFAVRCAPGRAARRSERAANYVKTRNCTVSFSPAAVVQLDLCWKLEYVISTYSLMRIAYSYVAYGRLVVISLMLKFFM